MCAKWKAFASLRRSWNCAVTKSHSSGQSTHGKASIQTQRRVQGIEEMTAPETKQQLQSFLGMVTYMGNFIPHLSHHTEPLRQLLKKDVTFYWDDQLTRSFQEIKHLLKKQTSKPLGYYDRRKEVIVQADASLRGLGACLLQDGKPIAFASKSLTGAESHYANIERELLAVVFACIRFNTYLQGRRFTVQSDHKPSGNDPSEEHAQCASTSSENAPTVTEI